MKRQRADAKSATTKPPSKRACTAERAGPWTDWLETTEKGVQSEVCRRPGKIKYLENAKHRTADMLKKGYMPIEHAGQMPDTQSFSYEYDMKTKLFDFQEAAVQNCLKQLNKHRTGVLALGTGLGKSHVMAHIVSRSKQKHGVLVVTMGGLVRQLTRSLRDTAGRKVASAETGEQLAKVAARDSPVLVVNGALRVGKNRIDELVLAHKGLLIIDEAHLDAQRPVLRAANCRSIGQLLLVTATPPMHGWLSDRPRKTCVNILRSQVEHVPWATGASKSGPLMASLVPSSLCFRIEKTEHVMRRLGLAMPKLKVIEAKIQDSQSYFHAVFHHVLSTTYGGPFVPTPMVLGTVLRCGLSLLPHVQGEYRQQLIDHLRPVALTSECLHLTQAQQHRCKELFGVVPRVATGDIGICQASGLREQDCQVLLSWNRDALNRVSCEELASQPLWARTSLRGWTSVLVRFSTKKEIGRVMSNYPLPADVLPFVLTNDMSAGQRARLIDRFASRDGQHAVLRVLQRGFAADPVTSVKHKVGRMGLGRYFFKTLESFLARPRVLLADETVSVGFDLHRHIDQIFIADLPTSRHDFVQLLGRVSRIAVDQQEQPPIEVVCTAAPCNMPVLHHISVDEDRAEPSSGL